VSINISCKEIISLSFFFHVLNMTIGIMHVMWDWILYIIEIQNDYIFKLYIIEIQNDYIFKPLLFYFIFMKPRLYYVSLFDNISVFIIYQITYYIIFLQK
jgi:hypothetical protein